MVRIDKIKIIINEDWKFEILFFVLMSGMRIQISNSMIKNENMNVMKLIDM